MLRMVISHIIPVSIVAFQVYVSSFRYTKEVALGEMHHRGYRLNTDNYYIYQLLFIWHHLLCRNNIYNVLCMEKFTVLVSKRRYPPTRINNKYNCYCTLLHF